MKNKLTDNDPRLTAYALGELSRDEAEEITDALSLGQNIAIKKEVESIDSLAVMLTQALSTPIAAEGFNEPQIKLRASQRDAIFRSAKAPTVDDVSSANQSRWLRPMIVTLGAAALVTLSLMILNNVDTDEVGVASLPDASFSNLSEDKLHAPILPSNKAWSASSANGGSFSSDPSENIDSVSFHGTNFGETESSIPKLIDNKWVNRAESHVTRIPLVCGVASWNWVSKSILENKVLPSKNAVRVEEIINVFDYEMPSDLQLKHASTSVDVVRCPWNENNLVAVIFVENTYQENIQIETAVSFSDNVNQYRLVGYTKSQNTDENVIAPAQVTLASKDTHLLMYEIVAEEGMQNAADVLSLNIRTAAALDGNIENDAQTLDLQFSDREWSKTNQGMQFALILATWSQLLSESEYVNSIDGKTVENMITSFLEKFETPHEQLKAIEVLRKGIKLL